MAEKELNLFQFPAIDMAGSTQVEARNNTR